MRIEIDRKPQLLGDAVIALRDLVERRVDLFAGAGQPVALVKQIRHLVIHRTALAGRTGHDDAPVRVREQDTLHLGKLCSVSQRTSAKFRNPDTHTGSPPIS